jgi:hypothetical protein
MAGRGSSYGDIRNVLAANQKPDKNKSHKANASKSSPTILQLGDTTYFFNKGETVTFLGNQYTAHLTMIHYRIGQHDISTMEKALVVRGANGGIVGEYMLVLERSELFVDIFGLAGHKVSQLRIVIGQALITTSQGNAIATFHQMTFLGKCNSILLCLQLEAFGADINNQPRSLPGGKQRILIDGYQLPLDFKNGLHIFDVASQLIMNSNLYHISS